MRGPWQKVRSQLSENFGSKPRWLVWLGLAAAVGAAYFLAARLSLFLLTEPDGVAVFWPAAGVASGILIALGPTARWPVAAGTMVATVLANLLGDRNFELAAISALCNAGEALIVAWLIHHNFGSNFALDNLPRVFGLIVAAALGAAVSGIGGTAGFILFHNSATPALTIWRHWFASDALGVVAIAPVLIGLASAIRNPPPTREVIEALVAIAAVVVTAWLAVFKLREPWAVIVPGALLYPIQLVLAARCQPFFGALTAFVVALTVVCTTTFGLGQFFEPDLPMEDRILAAQAAILVTALSVFVLSALFAERRKQESIITASESRMRAIVNTVVDGIITIDDQGTIENINPAAARIFGYNLEEAIGRNVRMLMPEPFRSEHARYLINYLRTGQAKMIGNGREVMGERKDGSIFPMELAISEMKVAGRTMFTGIVRDITERKLADEKQKTLTSELQHRTNNLLTVVQVIANRTLSGGYPLNEANEILEARLRALARANKRLTELDWSGLTLGEIIKSGLEPYLERCDIEGIDIVLGRQYAQNFSLILHELGTNAVKYGALSNLEGRVHITWGTKGEGRDSQLVFHWREQGGPPVVAPKRQGFGSTLLRATFATARSNFETNGFSCEIEVPFREVVPSRWTPEL